MLVETTMTFIPLLGFGVLTILLVVLFRRARSAARSSSHARDTWTPVMWTDVNADSSCDSSGTEDCSGGDTSCDGGGD